MKILIDQQEKLPLPFKVGGNISEVITKHLPFGDYWCELETGQEIPIMFERKSLPDLFSTLSNEDGIRRHKTKLEKATVMDCKLYLIIDGTLSDAYEGVTHTQVEPKPLVKRIFTFKVKYGFHPIFCQSPKEMVDYMIETWEAFGRNFKHLPLKTGLKNKDNGAVKIG